MTIASPLNNRDLSPLRKRLRSPHHDLSLIFVSHPKGAAHAMGASNFCHRRSRYGCAMLSLAHPCFPAASHRRTNSAVFHAYVRVERPPRLAACRT